MIATSPRRHRADPRQLSLPLTMRRRAPMLETRLARAARIARIKAALVVHSEVSWR